MLSELEVLPTVSLCILIYMGHLKVFIKCCRGTCIILFCLHALDLCYFLATPLEDVMGLLTCKSGHLQMFSKSDIPARHHYTNNRRIGDIIIDVQAQWMVGK